ncbi:MAG: hypothetical protein PHO80_05385 [Candidatus Gracilibacteria bacterium]|nr:hypothetical protein [Candidatus Gracilibacteria bacterium]MDD4530949.1 hypothetical protein [Candidatus Gracilibacteria bacterium]
MLINFARIYEKLFKSFSIYGDTNVVKELEENGIPYLMIIKRSWIFGLIISRILVVIFIIMLMNCYLVYKNFGNNTVTYVIIGILVFNILFWIYSVWSYLMRFKKIYGEKNIILKIKDLEEKLTKGDIAFERFFNQTIFNYILLFLITIYIVSNFIITGKVLKEGFWALANIALFIIQIFLASGMKKRFIDMQMDFNIITPKRVLFYNQSGMLMESQSIETRKIKTITCSYPNFIFSFFNLGNLAVSTEGDETARKEFSMFYVSSPVETVEEINSLIKEQFMLNQYLKQILKNLGTDICEWKNPENIAKIKMFLEEHGAQIKNDFNNGGDRIKKEIEEIYNIK